MKTGPIGERVNPTTMLTERIALSLRKIKGCPKLIQNGVLVYFREGHWNDIDCAEERRYICRYDSENDVNEFK